MSVNRRPLVFFAVAYILGIIIQYYFVLEQITILIIFGIILLFAYIFIFNKDIYVILLICFLMAGSLNFYFNNNLRSTLESFDNKEVLVLGNAISLNFSKTDEYILYIKQIISKEKTYNVDEKILLKVQDFAGEINLNNKKIIVKGILQYPKEARNPNMFSYRFYLKTKRIYRIIYADKFKIKILGEAKLPFYQRLKYDIKSSIYKRVLEILPENEGRIALSLVFGDKKILDEELYNTFKYLGIAHVLAISGLHFGIFYLFIDHGLKAFRVINRFKIIIILMLLWSFALLVGFSPSVLRAVTLITLYLVSNIIDRRYDIFTALSFICLITLIINPFILFNVGFQLSFTAVLSLGIFYKKIYNKLNLIPDLLKKIIASSVSVQIGISPIIAYHFNIFSIWAVFFNIPVVFLVGYILPITLIFFIFIFINQNFALFIGYIDKLLIKILIEITRTSFYMPISRLDVISPKMHIIVLYYFLLIVIFYGDFLLKNFNRNKIIFIMLILFFAIFLVNIYINNELTITFIDVGQGDSILIEAPCGKNVLIDGGRSNNYNFLAEFLLKNHIYNIDTIIITHIHNDHIGGIIDVVEMLNVRKIIIGTDVFVSGDFIELKKVLNEKHLKMIKGVREQEINIKSDLKIKILHPSLELIVNTDDDINNNSLVSLLQYKDIKILFTGDIQHEAEEYIMSNIKKIDIDILKIAHHGSKTSTSQKFIEFFTPEIAVIQVGKNFFGHPHEEVLKLLKENNIKVYRNDKSGAIIIKTDGKNIKVYEFLKKYDRRK